MEWWWHDLWEHRSKDVQNAGRNMLVWILWIKYVINTEVHLLVIYVFWIRLMHEEWNILKYTWQYLINLDSCFLHERSSVGILIGSLSNRTEVLYTFPTSLQMLVQSLTVCGDTLFSDIFQRVRNARLYFQLSDCPFLSHSFQFIIYYPSFTDIL
jgi:hypothetical protein